MVSNPESATLSNAPRNNPQQQQNNDDLTIICSLYSFYEPSFHSLQCEASFFFLLFSYQKYIFISPLSAFNYLWRRLQQESP